MVILSPNHKRRIVFLLLFLFFCSARVTAALQEESRDSAIDAAYDRIEVRILPSSDSTLHALNDLLKECTDIKYEKGIAKAYYLFGKSNILGAFNYPSAFEYFYKAQRIFDRYNLPVESAKCNMQIGLINYLQRNFGDAGICFTDAAVAFRIAGDTMRLRRTAYLYSLCASELKDFTKAEKGLHIARQFITYGNDNSAYREYYYGRGIYYARKNENDSAIANFLTVLNSYSEPNDEVGAQLFCGEIAQAYYNKGDHKNARIYAEKVIQISSKHSVGRGIGVLQSHNLLYKLDKEAKDYKGASEHLYEYILLKDSMMNERKSFELASIKSKYEIAKAEQENKLQLAKQASVQDAQIQEQRFLKNLFIVGCFFFVFMILFLVYTNNMKKRKNAELADSLVKLKSTQEQLIRQEKLASMGKLSAGIAHEIRNPLNFINNFSDISDELLHELAQSNSVEERSELLGNIHSAVKKIKDHGRRAEVIVNNMLDHSRRSVVEKEDCDINQLCENYLTIAIHAMEVQNNKFHYDVKKNYSVDLPQIQIVAADIGRVLLNLYNNAFFAMEEKRLELVESYSPLLSITTQMINNSIVIHVRDNGNGIPDRIKEHIFEPFFTTKAPGQGTGLGLSICNEIVKMHNGELQVDSEKGEFTEFRISLPIDA